MVAHSASRQYRRAWSRRNRNSRRATPAPKAKGRCAGQLLSNDVGRRRAHAALIRPRKYWTGSQRRHVMSKPGPGQMPSLETDQSRIQISIFDTLVQQLETMPARKHTKMFMFAADGFCY